MVEYALKGIALVSKEGKEILVGHILPIMSRFYQDYIRGKNYYIASTCKITLTPGG